MKISESIFNGQFNVVPMADVQHIEYHWYPTDPVRTRETFRGIKVITKHTRWDMEAGTWANNIYMDREEAKDFIKSWCHHRNEFEKHFTGL